MARIADARYEMDYADIWFDAVAGRAGRHYIEGTTGDDRLRGTDGGDNFHVEFGNAGDGGTDYLRGLAGNDHFFFGATYTDADYVNGGDGNDRLILAGTLDDQIVLGPDNLRDVESVKLLSGRPSSDYNITLLDGLSDLRLLGGNNSLSLRLDASALTTGVVKVDGGLNSDSIVGSAGDDVLHGWYGSDYLLGGSGNDKFVYTGFIDSYAGHADTIADFSPGDRIVLDILNSANLYHIGKTPGHAGDVVVHYDSGFGRTEVSVFLDGDDTSDMLIYLTGDRHDLSVIHDNQLIVA